MPRSDRTWLRRAARVVGRIVAVAVLALVTLVTWLLVTLGVARFVATPAVFLAAGTAAALAVWLGGCRLIGRGRPVRGGRGLRLAGVLVVVALVALVLVPLGDPVRAPGAPPGAGSWTLPDGGRIAYGVVRAAPGSTPAAPVVVLHGGPGVPDLAGHLRALRPLAADGHDVWAYAQRGAGGSSRLTDPRGYTIARGVEDLERVRLRIGAPRVILLGHSYGAFLAAAYLAEHPDRVAKVIFSSPGDLDQAGLGGHPQTRLDDGRRLRLYALLAPPRALLAYGLLQMNPDAAYAFAADRELDARQDRVFAATLPAMHCPGVRAPRLYGWGSIPTRFRNPLSTARCPTCVPLCAGCASRPWC